jgi:hypothetical protein
MGAAEEQQGAQGPVNYCLGSFKALRIVADEAQSPIIQPKVRSTAPSARDDIEAHRHVGAADDLGNELADGGRIRELRPVVARVGEHVLQPRP